MKKSVIWGVTAAVVVLLIVIFSGEENVDNNAQQPEKLTVEQVQKQVTQLRSELAAVHAANRNLTVSLVILAFLINTAGLAGLGWYFKRLVLGGAAASSKKKKPAAKSRPKKDASKKEEKKPENSGSQTENPAS